MAKQRTVCVCPKIKKINKTSLTPSENVASVIHPSLDYERNQIGRLFGWAGIQARDLLVVRRQFPTESKTLWLFLSRARQTHSSIHLWMFFQIIKILNKKENSLYSYPFGQSNRSSQTHNQSCYVMRHMQIICQIWMTVSPVSTKAQRRDRHIDRWHTVWNQINTIIIIL